MKHFVILTLLVTFSISKVLSQTKSDSTKKEIVIAGDISVTNNGISIVPAFSLGHPALLVNLAMGGKKLTFEPSWYFSAQDGKPWAYLLWARYKLFDNSKFKMRIGSHYGNPISDIQAVSGGTSYNVQQIQRFAAIEIAPTYIVNKYFSLNFYLLRARALQKESLQNNRFIAFTPSFGLDLGKKVSVRYSPQFYHLKLDDLKGIYVFHSLALSKKDCPLLASFNMNQYIKTKITAGKNYDWNVTLTYLFNRQLVKK